MALRRAPSQQSSPKSARSSGSSSASARAEASSRAQVLVEQERLAPVEADALEDAVAVEQPVVEHVDRRRLRRAPLAIDVRHPVARHRAPPTVTIDRLVTIGGKVTRCPPIRTSARSPRRSTPWATAGRCWSCATSCAASGATPTCSARWRRSRRTCLADRLRRLEDLGLVERVVYSQRPLRAEYHLTERGRALAPVIITLGRFGIDQLGRPGAGLPRRARRLRRARAADRVALPACGEDVRAGELELLPPAPPARRDQQRSVDTLSDRHGAARVDGRHASAACPAAHRRRERVALHASSQAARRRTRARPRSTSASTGRPRPAGRRAAAAACRAP